MLVRWRDNTFGMKKISIDDVKKIELDLLIQFKKFCEEEELTFFLGGGTLLGAIRHEGFIPWDDDIDLIMPRTDYQKMIRILKEKSIGEDIQIQCVEFHNTEYPFVKLVNRRTLIKEKYVQEKENKSIWIDIFPLDVVPDSESECKRVCRRISFYKMLLAISHSKPLNASNLKKKMGKMILYPFLQLVGSKRLAALIQKTALKFIVDESNYRMVLVWGYGMKERLPGEVFAEKVEVKFEGTVFPAPIGWHVYLSSLYGDYNTLPPENERITHEFEAWRI